MRVPADSITSFVVALTGGIASGKTAVSDAFAELGATVIDTDIIAREVVATGTSGLVKVVEVFGTKILSPNGRLDRRLLRKIIFADTQKRKLLEDILHPLIRTAALQQLQAANTTVSILVVPLLVESGTVYNWVKRVLVVDVSEAAQIQRLLQRDGVDLVQAEAIIASQASGKQRLQIADDVLINNGDLAELKTKVITLYQQYLHLASSAN